MKVITTILFIQFTLISMSFGQKGQIAKGYIVDLDGQKIEGFIQIPKRVESGVRVKFSEKKKAKKLPVYKTKDLSAYGFETTKVNNSNETVTYWRHFEKFELDRPAKMFNTNFSLIEKILEGHLTIYLFEYDTGANVEEPITMRYIVMQDGEELCQIEMDNFEDACKSLFEGYTSMVKSIGKKQFRFKNFERLVDDFNYWNENQHDPNIYKMNPKIYAQ